MEYSPVDLMGIPSLCQAEPSSDGAIANCKTGSIPPSRTRRKHPCKSRGVCVVGLSSVKRTLRRQGLTKPESKWKRFRPHIERP